MTRHRHQRKQTFLLGVILTGCLQILNPQTGYTFDDAIIAVVDDELITLKDLRDYVHSVYTQLEMDPGYPAVKIQEIMKQVEETAIDRLIEDRLILNAANRLGVQVKPELIDAKIIAVQQRYPSEKEFITYLSSQGITLSDLRQKFENQLKSQLFVDHEIKSQIQVNPQEITDFYHNQPEKFQRPERADVESIFIPLGSDPQKAGEAINAAKSLLESGQVFAEVAKNYSTIPPLGVISRGQMKPDIEEQIFSLADGAISPVVETDQGYFIFRVKSRLPPDTIPLNDAKEQITQFLFNEKLKQKLQDWLEEQRKETYIEIKTP